MFEWLRNRLRRRTVAQLGITEAEWNAVEAGLPCLARLDDAERMRLRALAQSFIVEKQWVGAGGLALDASMQISIALQACLLVLNLGLEWYRGWVGIVVYPGDFIIPRKTMDENGIVHEYDDFALGEAWEGGPVLLSWFPPKAQPLGINVVIHEFAHKLDMRQGGVANGRPPLHRGMSRKAWQTILGDAYEHFQQAVDRGEEIELDPYGAERSEEFFAVLSEAFFETPQVILRHYPAVYDQLRQFYRQDPCVAC